MNAGAMELDYEVRSCGGFAAYPGLPAATDQPRHISSCNFGCAPGDTCLRFLPGSDAAVFVAEK